MNKKLDQWLTKMPVVAILRGVRPDEVVKIGTAIREVGIGIIEVPLNSPEALSSITILKDALGEECVVGCGTLINKTDVKKVFNAGAEVVVTPNTRPAIIKECIKHGMTPIPGWSTPSEAFKAYQAGARYLKLFPASTYGTDHVKALRAVLPKDANILAVGGVSASDAATWFQAGIDGIGIGSDIYQPGFDAHEVSNRAKAIVNTIEDQDD